MNLPIGLMTSMERLVANIIKKRKDLGSRQDRVSSKDCPLQELKSMIGGKHQPLLVQSGKGDVALVGHLQLLLLLSLQTKLVEVL